MRILPPEIRPASVGDVSAMFEVRASVGENTMTSDELAAIGVPPEAIALAVSNAPCAWVATIDEKVMDVKERCAIAGIAEAFSAHLLCSGFVTEVGCHNQSLPDTIVLTGHRSVSTVLGYFRAEASLASPFERLMDDD